MYKLEEVLELGKKIGYGIYKNGEQIAYFIDHDLALEFLKKVKSEEINENTVFPPEAPKLFP